MSNNNSSFSPLSFLTSLRTVFLRISKLSFICVSFYYIYNYKLFSVTINATSYLRSFSIIDIPLSFLENLGLLLIIFPLTIVILSLIYPTSMVLNILSAFFSISGNIFTMIHLASQGLLEESFRAGILTVYHEVSLEAKQKLFEVSINERMQFYISQVINQQEFISYVKTSIETDWLQYVKILKSSKIDTVKEYAYNIIDKFHQHYIEIQAAKNTHIPLEAESNITNFFSVKNVLLCTAGIIILGYIFYRMYNGATIIRDTTKELKEIGKAQTDLYENTKAINNIALNQQVVNEIVSTNVTTIVSTISNQTNVLMTTAASHATAIEGLRVIVDQIVQNINSNSLNSLNVVPSESSSISANLTSIEELINVTQSISLNTKNNFENININIATINERLIHVEDEIQTLITTSNKPQSISDNVNLNVLSAAESRQVVNASDNAKKALDLVGELKRKMVSFENETRSKMDVFLEESTQTINTMGIEQKAITNMDVKLNKVSIISNENKEVITLMHPQIMDQEKRMSTMEATMPTIQQDITTLQNNVSTLQQDLVVLRKDFVTFKESSISMIKDVKNTIISEIKDLGNTIALMPKQIANVAQNNPATTLLTGALAFHRNVGLDRIAIATNTYNSPVSNSSNMVNSPITDSSSTLSSTSHSQTGNPEAAWKRYQQVNEVYTTTSTTTTTKAVDSSLSDDENNNLEELDDGVYGVAYGEVETGYEFDEEDLKIIDKEAEKMKSRWFDI